MKGKETRTERLGAWSEGQALTLRPHPHPRLHHRHRPRHHPHRPRA